jgi:hypothetical protein
MKKEVNYRYLTYCLLVLKTLMEKYSIREKIKTRHCKLKLFRKIWEAKGVNTHF